MFLKLFDHHASELDPLSGTHATFRATSDSPPDELDQLLRGRFAAPRQAQPDRGVWDRIDYEMEPIRSSGRRRVWAWLWGPIETPDVFTLYPSSLQWFATRGMARVC